MGSGISAPTDQGPRRERRRIAHPRSTKLVHVSALSIWRANETSQETDVPADATFMWLRREKLGTGVPARGLSRIKAVAGFSRKNNKL